MGTTSSELTLARSWIGEKETAVTFDERFDRLLLSYSVREEAFNAAIEESLRAQLAKMVQDRPSSMAVEGVSISWTTNITTLRDRLKEFQASVRGSSRARVIPLYRAPTR